MSFELQFNGELTGQTDTFRPCQSFPLIIFSSMETYRSGKALPFPQLIESLKDSPSTNAESFSALVKGSPYASIYQKSKLGALIKKEELVTRIATDLQAFALQADPTDHIPSMFDIADPSKISIHNYLIRVGQHSKCSPESLVLSLIYMDRYVALSQLVVTRKNMHRCLKKTLFYSSSPGNEVQRRPAPE